MTFRIRESAAAKRLNVYVILDRKGAHVATVRVLFPADGAGRVRAEVDHTPHGLELCAKAPHCWARIAEHGRKHDAAGRTYRDDARELFGRQTGSADGFGYDKQTAALAGLIVAGHTLADHCGRVPEDEKKRVRLLAAYNRNPNARHRDAWRAAAERIGASWANWRDGRYLSLHFLPGLNRLESAGFSVIDAL